MTCVRLCVEDITALHSMLIARSGGLETLGWGLADGSINEAELLDWIISHN